MAGIQRKKEDDQPITGQELDDQNFINSMHGGWLDNHKAIKVQCCKGTSISRIFN